MGSFQVSDRELGNLARRHQELFRRVAEKSLPGDRALRDLKHLTKQSGKKGKKKKGNGAEALDTLDGQLAFIYSEMALLFSQVKSGLLPYRDTLISLQQVIEGVFRPEPPNPTLVHDLFLSRQDQLVQMEVWNRDLGWGFKPKDFERLAQNMPDWPRDKLTAVVLVPRLPAVEPPKQRPKGMAQKAWKKHKHDFVSKSGLQVTLEALWQVIDANHVTAWKSPHLLFDQGHMRLAPKNHYQPGLRWEIINLGANEGAAVKDLAELSALADVGVFAAMALHHTFLEQINGDTIPFVLAAGIKADLSVDRGPASTLEPWSSVPGFFFKKKQRRLALRAIGTGTGFAGHACPQVVGTV